MGRLAALMQAGDANTSDFGRNPLWADVLVEVSDDEAHLEACCDYSSTAFDEVRIAPVFKAPGMHRNFVYMHPALAHRWSRIGERIHPEFSGIAARFSSSCFSNLKQRSGKQIAKKGLFKVTWSTFLDAQRRMLGRGRCLGVLDLANFFPSITPAIIEKLMPRHLRDTRLVDDTARFVADLGVGLPQNSATSQMIAHVLLASVDEEMERYGFLYARYVDDIRIGGPRQLDVARDMAHFNGIIEEAGFAINPDKTRCHASERAFCLPALGGCPGPVNIEDYVLSDEDMAGFGTELDSPYPTNMRRLSHEHRETSSPNEPFDSVRLFEDHVDPQLPLKSAAVERYAVRRLVSRGHPLFKGSQYELAVSRLGSEGLYSKAVDSATALAVGIEAMAGERGRDPAHQHRAVKFLAAAAQDQNTAVRAITNLCSLYDADIPPHIELEFCAEAKAHRHRYAATLPILRKGIEDPWPDVSVARIGATMQLGKEDRNRFLCVAKDVHPAGKVACRLVKAAAL